MRRVASHANRLVPADFGGSTRSQITASTIERRLNIGRVLADDGRDGRCPPRCHVRLP